MAIQDASSKQLTEKFNNRPFRQTISVEREDRPEDLFKAKINRWLIGYFNYLVWGLAILIFIIGLLLFVFPNYKQLNQANQAAKENLLAEYDKRADYLNSVINLKKSFQLVRAEEMKKIITMLPSGSNVGGIMSEIETIALKNGAILKSIKINPDNDQSSSRLKTDSGEKIELPVGIFTKLPTGVSRLKIEVSFASINYPIFKNIIKTFENNLRLFDIAKIDYDAADNKAVLLIYSYYLSS